jgi:hypothetical protein
MIPVLDWIEAAIPQQNQKLLAGLRKEVQLNLTGVAGRTITLGVGEPAARITSDTASFVLWITQRAQWEHLGVTAEGDPTVLSTIRQVKVF